MVMLETIAAATLLCNAAARRELEPISDHLQVVGRPLLVQRATGNTLEYMMLTDIESLPGVVSVSAKRTGDTFDVSVVMENMDFEPYDAVIRKKVALFDAYPSLTFNFDLMPVDAIEAPAPSSHAA